MGLESVADAGPLIHLAEIEALSVFQIFDKVVVPQTVYDEVRLQTSINQDRIFSPANFQTLSPSQIDIDNYVREHELATLQPGELAALFLCHSAQIPVFLTDDLAARQAGQRLQLTPVGSLGIIVRAFHNQLLTLELATEYLRRLQSVSSLYITDAIVELAIEQLSGRQD